MKEAKPSGLDLQEQRPLLSAGFSLARCLRAPLRNLLAIFGSDSHALDITDMARGQRGALRALPGALLWPPWPDELGR